MIVVLIVVTLVIGCAVYVAVDARQAPPASERAAATRPRRAYYGRSQAPTRRRTTGHELRATLEAAGVALTPLLEAPDWYRGACPYCPTGTLRVSTAGEGVYLCEACGTTGGLDDWHAGHSTLAHRRRVWAAAERAAAERAVQQQWEDV